MNFFEKHVSIGSFEFPKLRVMRDCMPMWSACQRACVPTWFMCQCACIPAWFTCQPVCVPTCQKRANFSFLHANVLMNMPMYQTACQPLKLSCQHTKERANFSDISLMKC